MATGAAAAERTEMSRTLISAFMLLAVTAAQAQVTVPEPEFLNSYCILTSDSTYEILPKENGSIGVHQTKAKNALKAVGKIANVAAAAGGLGSIIGANTGNIDGLIGGVKTASTSLGVGMVAGAVSGLAGATGMDIIFSGTNSRYIVEADGNDVRILIKAENNDMDPMSLYRIVRLNILKKERRIQWQEYEPSVLGIGEAKDSGYLQFAGHKYGEQSYLLTVPAEEILTGEYAIFYMNLATATSVPVGTFGVR